MRVDERDDVNWREERNAVALVVYDAVAGLVLYAHRQTLLQTTRRGVRIPTTSRLALALLQAAHRLPIPV